MIMKRKSFFLYEDNQQYINWKSVLALKQYQTRFWAIKPRKYTWVPVKIQKKIRQAIIRARELGVMNYTK